MGKAVEKVSSKLKFRNNFWYHQETSGRKRVKSGRKRVRTGAEMKWSIKRGKKRKTEIHEVIDLSSEEESDEESTNNCKKIDERWLIKDDRYNIIAI